MNRVMRLCICIIFFLSCKISSSSTGNGKLDDVLIDKESKSVILTSEALAYFKSAQSLEKFLYFAKSELPDMRYVPIDEVKNGADSVEIRKPYYLNFIGDHFKVSFIHPYGKYFLSGNWIIQNREISFIVSEMDYCFLLKIIELEQAKTLFSYNDVRSSISNKLGYSFLEIFNYPGYDIHGTYSEGENAHEGTFVIKLSLFEMRSGVAVVPNPDKKTLISNCECDQYKLYYAMTANLGPEDTSAQITYDRMRRILVEPTSGAIAANEIIALIGGVLRD